LQTKQQRCETFVAFSGQAFSRCSAPKYYGALHLENRGCFNSYKYFAALPLPSATWVKRQKLALRYFAFLLFISRQNGKARSEINHSGLCCASIF
jgi:hypothetical protein